jgi:uncharacterized damage-inducible protein DinB
MSFDLATRFLERSRHYLCDEYPLKIDAAVRAMPADRLWWRANAQANSAGNLVLHLAGNVRQWVVSGIGGAPDVRRRDAEFAARDGADADALLAEFAQTIDEVRHALTNLPPTSLGESRVIQGRETSVFGALYHVVEHFAGHTGQIILLAKSFTPGAVRFYDDTGGLARPLFMPPGHSDIA